MVITRGSDSRDGSSSLPRAFLIQYFLFNVVIVVEKRIYLVRKMLTTKHSRNDDSPELGYSSARNCLTATVRYIIISIRGNNVNRNTITMVRLMYTTGYVYDVFIMYV